jgi:Protein of unknown function (DUF1761)
MLVTVNYVAVLISAVAAMVLGFIWYHPKVFGNKWMSYLGKKDMTTRNPNLGYALTFLGALIMSWVLAEVLKFSAAETIPGALKIALLMWLGFTATTHLSNALFSGKKKEVYLLEQGNHLTTILVAAVILTMLK